MKTTWCYLWSYDNFTYEYEESDKDYETLQECIKAMWEDRKINQDLMKDKLVQEPKIYYMFKKKKKTKKTYGVQIIHGQEEIIKYSYTERTYYD